MRDAILSSTIENAQTLLNVPLDVNADIVGATIDARQVFAASFALFAIAWSVVAAGTDPAGAAEAKLQAYTTPPEIEDQTHVAAWTGGEWIIEPLDPLEDDYSLELQNDGTWDLTSDAENVTATLEDTTDPQIVTFEGRTLFRMTWVPRGEAPDTGATLTWSCGAPAWEDVGTTGELDLSEDGSGLVTFGANLRKVGPYFRPVVGRSLAAAGTKGFFQVLAAAPPAAS